jgi:hypothetical protein
MCINFKHYNTSGTHFYYETTGNWKGVQQTPWPEPASELYQPSDRRLSGKLVPTFADRGCHVVSAADPLWPYSRFS